MPTKTQDVAETEAVDQVPAVVPCDDGFYHEADWIRVECDWDGLKPRPGFSPLWAEIDASLTIREASQIPNPFESSIADLLPHISKRVREWNAKAPNIETGKMEPVPPPSEIGLEAFLTVKTSIIAWLAFTLKTLHLGGGPKGLSATQPSGGGSSGTSDDA